MLLNPSHVLFKHHVKTNANMNIIKYFIILLIYNINIMISGPILGILSGIIICLYIHNFIQKPTLTNFIEPFIIFGFVLFFSYFYLFVSTKFLFIVY